MRIYDNCYELMSETGRNLWEMGAEVRPKTYQNKIIEGNDDFVTRELICEQYCLTGLNRPEYLFLFDTRSKDWTDAEFKERVNNLDAEHPINPGEAYKLRPDLWEQFLDKDGQFDYTYNERIRYRSHDGHNNLDNVINQLIIDNQTRKAILPIFSLRDISVIDGSARMPCSMYYDFLIRVVNDIPQLNISYHQRSADFVTHFGNDIYLAWKLMEFVAEAVGVKPGYLYHTIDSLHSYKKDWPKLKSSVGDFKLD